MSEVAVPAGGRPVASGATTESDRTPSASGAEVLAYFDRLGDRVDQAWSAAGRRADLLPDIATRSLSDLPVPDSLSPEVILSLLADGSHLPKQRASSDTFGQPPAVVYRRPDLEIQAITWMEGTTSTHQHAFDGAFRVLWGSSLHVGYSFDQHETLADGHLVAGRLAMLDSEILWPGDVRPIVAGPGFIHALFHLERPSVTLVVRNASSGLPFPQYDYRLPGLGFDVLHSDDRLQMRLRGLHSLYRLDRAAAATLACDVTATQDLWTAFRVCDDWALTYGEGDVLSDLIEVMAGRSEVFDELLPPMYAEEVRRGRLLSRRGLLRESRHRLFLALIVNLPDRKSIHEAVRQLFPGEDPNTLVVDLVEELASPAYRGISGLSMSPDQLAVLKAQLADGGAGDALGMVASSWQPPALLETLFS
jgi:hypothetical protein